MLQLPGFAYIIMYMSCNIHTLTALQPVRHADCLLF
jgi:hypothetical protein